MDPTVRFAELVQRPDAEIPLDEALFLIAAHDHDVDPVAERAPSDPDALARHLFVDEQYAGNDVDYTDPRNSYLDVVLDRRLGIPITLSILMIEVGRRSGATLAGSLNRLKLSRERGTPR